MVTISSSGTDTEDAFDKSLIKSNKVSFHPSTKVKSELKTVSYTKVV